MKESLTKEEIEELYEIRSAWDDATEREKYILVEALYDLIIQYKRKKK